MSMMLASSRALAVPLAPRIVGQLAELALRMDAPDAAHTLGPICLPASGPNVPARQSILVLMSILKALAGHIPEVPNPNWVG